jgi:hypothetical protein
MICLGVFREIENQHTMKVIIIITGADDHLQLAGQLRVVAGQLSVLTEQELKKGMEWDFGKLTVSVAPQKGEDGFLFG